MDKNPSNQYEMAFKKYSKKEAISSEDDDMKIVPDNTFRRSAMHFSTIKDFLGSLNTATTAVSALQGMQEISLETYQKCMKCAKSEDDAASQLKANKSVDAQINKHDS